MNKEQTKEAIKVMQAYVDGEEIEYRNREHGKEFKRIHPDSAPIWSWEIDEYRIKPKPREFWLNEFDNGHITVNRTEQAAILEANSNTLRTIKVREVLDDD